MTNRAWISSPRSVLTIQRELASSWPNGFNFSADQATRTMPLESAPAPRHRRVGAESASRHRGLPAPTLRGSGYRACGSPVDRSDARPHPAPQAGLHRSTPPTHSRRPARQQRGKLCQHHGLGLVRAAATELYPDSSQRVLVGGGAQPVVLRGRNGVQGISSYRLTPRPGSAPRRRRWREYSRVSQHMPTDYVLDTFEAGRRG